MKRRARPKARRRANPATSRRRVRALGGVDPRGLPPSMPYPCTDPRLGERVAGDDFAGTVVACATPPPGKRGPHFAVGTIASGSAIGRAWKRRAARAEALRARYEGEDFDARGGHAKRPRAAALPPRESIDLPAPEARAEAPAPRARRHLPVIQPKTRRRLRVVQGTRRPPEKAGPAYAPKVRPKVAPCRWRLTVDWSAAAGEWVATGDTFSARDDLRAAGFTARKTSTGYAWWTRTPASAAKLRGCMTPAAVAALENGAAAPPAPAKPAVVLSFESGRFLAQGDTRGMNDSLKAAGWRASWERGTGPGGRDRFLGWSTDRAEVANSLAAYATPETAAELARQLAARDRDLAASRAATEADIEGIRPGFTCAMIPAPAGLAYLPYQCAGIAYAAERPGVLIGDEMGLGKTVQAIGVVNADPSIRRVLVVCPASLRDNWRRHFDRWLVRPLRVHIVRDGGGIPDDAEVAIFSFQGTIARGEAAQSQAYRDAMARTWDLLVVDEAHFLKNPKAKRTAAIVGTETREGKDTKLTPGLAQRARRRLFLTGTPLPNRPIELWPILHALNPDVFSNFWTFARRYCAAERTRFGWDFTGSSNENELQELMRRTVMIRRLKRDVLKDLPPKRRAVVPLDPEIGRPVLAKLAARAWKRYLDREAARGIDDEPIIEGPEELLEMWMAELAETSDRLRGQRADLAEASQAMGSRAKVAFDEMSSIREELAIAKAPHVATFVEEVLAERPKVVVMAHHRKVQDALVKHLRKLLGDEAVVLHRGGLSDAEKTAAETAFQTDSRVRVFVGSIMASGVGITLTAADHLVMAEVDWVPGNNAQAEDRIHRIGQSLPVTISYLVVDGTIDATLVQTCVQKLDVADRVLDEDTRRALLRDPITAPVRRGPQSTLEAWALDILARVAALPGSTREASARDVDFARRTVADPSLTDRQWRVAVAIAVRFTGGSMKRVEASMAQVPRPARTPLEVWAGAAMLTLADDDVDRARERNGVGFSSSDGYEGHALAALLRAEAMTDGDWRSAIRLASRYRRQVGAPPRADLPRENPSRRRLPPPRRRAPVRRR